jgi:hypothetical protein
MDYSDFGRMLSADQPRPLQLGIREEILWRITVRNAADRRIGALDPARDYLLRPSWPGVPAIRSDGATARVRQRAGGGMAAAALGAERARPASTTDSAGVQP